MKSPRRRAGRLAEEADRARDRRDWSAAAAGYASALALRPDWEPIWVQLGHMRKEAGDLAGAERAYGRAALLGSTSDDLVRERDVLHRLGYDADGATPALAMEPESPTRSRRGGGRAAGAVRRGDAARDRRDWAAAAAAYAEAVEADPSRAAIWVQLGHMRKEAGDVGAAEAAYGRALSLEPHDADTWVNVGLLFKLAKREQDAADAYAHAAALDRTVGGAPAEVEAYAGRGIVARSRPPIVGGRRPDDTPTPPDAAAPVAARPRSRPVRKGWTRGVERWVQGLDPRVRRTRELVREANAFRDRRDWPPAAAAYGRALQVDPGMAHIWVQLGHAAKEGGDFDGAERAYDEALRRDPENGDTHLNRGHLLKMRDRPAEALAAYRRAVELEPERTDWAREVVAAAKLADARDGTGAQAEIAADPLIRLLRELGRGGSAAQAIASLGPAEAARTVDALAAREPATPSPPPSRAAPGEPPAAPPRAPGAADVVFDISDLLSFFTHSRLPTGIQRVQIEAVSAVLLAPPEGAAVGVCAFSEARGCWSAAPDALFLEVCRLALAGDDAAALDWRIAVGRLEVAFEVAGPLAFSQGAVLVNLGASWEQGNYYLALRQAKARRGVLYVPFVHDLIPVVAPDFHVEALTRDFLGWLRSLLAHADGVLANSAHTLEDLRRTAAKLGAPLPGDREEVVHLDARINAELDGAIDGEVLRKYGVEAGGFVLFVSTVEPRKGHLTAFGAWAQLLREHGARTPKLVCVGRLGWMHDAVTARLRSTAAMRDTVQIASGVSDHELDTLYRACAFTLYASAYEGWGLPITESLTYGKVPLTSDHPSLREAGGAFSELFETGSERSLAAAVTRLAFDEAHRRRAEARIADDYRPRAWEDVGRQITDAVVRWRADADVAPRAVAPFPMTPGRHHGLGRNRDTALDPGRSSSEVFRRGDGWNGPDWWGCWTKPGPALLSFSTPPSPAPLRLYLGLRGPPSQPARYRVAAGGATLAEGRLEADRVQWICRTLPETASSSGEVTLTIAGDADWPLEGRPEPRRGGIGVVGFMVCEEGDLLARTRFVEEHMSEQLALLG